MAALMAHINSSLWRTLSPDQMTVVADDSTFHAALRQVTARYHRSSLAVSSDQKVNFIVFAGL